MQAGIQSHRPFSNSPSGQQEGIAWILHGVCSALVVVEASRIYRVDLSSALDSNPRSARESKISQERTKDVREGRLCPPSSVLKVRIGSVIRPSSTTR